MQHMALLRATLHIIGYLPMHINWSLNSGYISKFPYSYITTTHGITVQGNIAHSKIIWTSQNQGIKDQLH